MANVVAHVEAVLPSEIVTYLAKRRAPIVIIRDMGLSRAWLDGVVMGDDSRASPIVLAHELMHLADFSASGDDGSLGREMAFTPAGREYVAYLKRRIAHSMAVYGDRSVFARHYDGQFDGERWDMWGWCECFAGVVFAQDVDDPSCIIEGLDTPTCRQAIARALDDPAFSSAYARALSSLADVEQPR